MFPGEASHLARYAARLPAVEINSSFYRAHRRSTYERWAASVPPSFRFAVKAPKEITHDRRFVDCHECFDAFLGQVIGLGDKLGPILLQLPPSMEFERQAAARFLGCVRDRFDGLVVVEPRHADWFTGDVEAMLGSYRIARVAADPAVVPAAAHPGGWPGIVYYRLHGSPVMYESAYGDERIRDVQSRLSACEASTPVWCIFDNTKYGAATVDALALLEMHRVDEARFVAVTSRTRSSAK